MAAGCGGFEKLAYVLEQHEQMERIGRGWQEVELPVVAPGGIVLGMDCECADAGKIGCLHGPQHGILEQCAPDSLFLPVLMHCQAGKQHDRDWMPGQSFPQPLGRVGIFDLPGREAIVSNDHAVDYAQVGLRRVRSLVLQGVLDEPSIQVRLPAIEGFEGMAAAQLFYASGLTQRERRFACRAGAMSKKPGSCSSARNPGRGRTGALSAAWKAVQASALRPKVRRSTSVSSALARALSMTKSLMERCDAAAAAWSLALADLDTRTSSFSVRRSVTTAELAMNASPKAILTRCDDIVKTRIVSFSGTRQRPGF
jgi:hypothetical protein